MSDEKLCLGSPPAPDCDCGTGLVRCPDCAGLARIADAACPRCESGYLPACANCGAEPVDPMFAPACSGACRDAWEAKQRAAQPAPPIVTRAP